MKLLVQYGWSELHALEYDRNTNKELLPGRVISIQGFKYILITESGEREATLSGKLLFGALDEDIPGVGDWVLFLDYDPSGYIVEMLPRANSLVRKEPGTKAGTQLLAANVDNALIVTGLDRDFNVRRIERYIVQVTACSIHPVVLLSKSDLVQNPEDYVSRVNVVACDCPVYACSTRTGSGIDTIRSEVLKACQTNILIGSSGAGKSTLLNLLMDADIQRTGAVSDVHGKGKHTTSTRELFMLGNGSLVIDSPGMREFGLTAGAGDSSAELFPAIAALAPSCKYSDCTHMNENSCAVREALERGELAEEVYASYVKLIKEQKHFQLTASDKKRIGKQTGKMIREVKEFKKRYKGR